MTGQYNAWNPGLDSDIPRHLLPLVTLFREENGSVDYNTAHELSELTGIALNTLVAFRPERLVVHNLLVRVTADLSVQDGPSYEELGINLRGMVDDIYSKHMQPEMDAICSLFTDEKAKVEHIIATQLSTKIFDVDNAHDTQADRSSLLSRILGKKTASIRPTAISESAEILAINQWNALAQNDITEIDKACFRALAKTVNLIVGNHGRLRIEQPLLTNIITNDVCNHYVAGLLDKFIEPIWSRAVDMEGFRRLPVQSKPVVMNVKGASASGKSTIRPRQRELAGKLDIPWDDFALISPDYWRKYLLDYQSLGDDFKYGAMLTGTELEIIDKKLDRYMAGKQESGTMSHLLIDRFRFDSFTLDIDRTSDSKLLSRFGEEVYLFFMVTPPSETVERAWLRGKDTGRYKAVDDLLYHNIEAFTGMPSLFLSWVNSKDRKVHFEFLDNDVPLGTLPKTAAFGWNGIMTILDLKLLLNIDRYRHVDITATQPDQALKSDEADIGSYTDFVLQCSKTVSRINFADQQTLDTYASIENGKLIWWDDDYISLNNADVALLQTLQAFGFSGEPCELSEEYSPTVIDHHKERHFLVGQYGTQQQAVMH